MRRCTSRRRVHMECAVVHWSRLRSFGLTIMMFLTATRCPAGSAQDSGNAIIPLLFYDCLLYHTLGRVATCPFAAHREMLDTCPFAARPEIRFYKIFFTNFPARP